MEILLAVAVAHATSWGLTILLLLLLSAAGLVLLPRLARARLRSRRAGGDPAVVAGDLAVLVTGSLLLVLPGFLTAFVGLLFLAPGSRTVLRRLVGGRLRVATPTAPWRRPGRPRRSPPDRHDVIDGEVDATHVVDVRLDAEPGRDEGRRPR